MALILLVLFGILLYAFIKHPKQTYITLITLPRDMFGLYKYICTSIFSNYCLKRNMTASKFFDKNVEKRKMKVCFLFEDEIWTYKKVQEETLKIAKYFYEAGYRKGDVVGLFMENRPEYVCVWLGLSRLGIVTSLLNYNLRLDSLEHCIRASKCKGLIFGTELSSAINELTSQGDITDVQLYAMKDREPLTSQELTFPHIDLTENLAQLESSNLKKTYGEVNSGDVVLHIFTSGTTGLPKAAVLKNSRLFTYGASYFIVSMDASKDILMTPVPLYHTQGGIIGVTCAIFHGVPQVIIRRFSASKFWEQCVRYDVTCCQYLGEIIRYLYNQPDNPYQGKHKLRFFFGNGINAAVWSKFVERFKVKVIEVYGSTEGNCNLMNLQGRVGATAYLPIWLKYFRQWLPVMLARVDPVTREFLRDPETGFVKELDPGTEEPGEFVGKIINTNPMREFNGYTNEKYTEKTLVQNVRQKGDLWFRTGDTFTMDSYGYIYFKDRTGDTFKWKGENVSTCEVENVMSKATDYKANVVYGVKVPGCEGKCGMVSISDPEGNLDLKKVEEKVVQHLPTYARPLFLRVMKTEIYMTGTYKLQKHQLQAEGFDIELIPDDIYLLQNERYSLLQKELYNQIIEGSLRI